MCGIFGSFHFQSRPLSHLEVSLRSMAASLAHRGPDGEGFWYEESEAGQGILALGHRRLATRDLSHAGHQPMVSLCERYVLTYNGEIYNISPVAQELMSLGHRFRGTSDTEVLLQACAQWGIAGALEKIDGMFAFALWDRNTRTLTLARDRMGIKPLYWKEENGSFFFASELKALVAEGDPLVVSSQSVMSFLHLGYVPAPHSIWKNIHKVEPGTFISIPYKSQPRSIKYWDLATLATFSEDVSAWGYVSAKRRLKEQLNLSIQHMMVADVPVGSFLSGGIDSSLITALMQDHSRYPVETFTLGFSESTHDESPYAREIAAHLGTRHHELIVRPKEMQDLIPSLATIYDEPFADSSQIPTCLVSALARQHVTVALSGDGGDELFGGYNRHRMIPKMWSWFRWMPFRHAVGGWLGKKSLEEIRQWSDRFLPQHHKIPHLGEKIHKVAAAMGASSPWGMYQNVIQFFSEDQLGQEGLWQGLFSPAGLSSKMSLSKQIRVADMQAYLPDDIFTKVDRASMRVALEVRVPFMDRHVVQQALGLPEKALFSKGGGKRILREILAEKVPLQLFDRPKMGFGLPLGEWLKTDLRPWAESHMTRECLEMMGVGELWPVVSQCWSEHLSSIANHEAKLWSILMLSSWMDRWKVH